MGRIIRGYWDCQYCGQKGIDGGRMNCSACGHQRDDSVTFYMKSADEYVSEEEAKKVSRNPDWQCSFCNALNSDNIAVCKGCGASREDSEKNYFDVQREKAEKARAEAAAVQASASGSKQTPKRPKWMLLVLLALVGVLIFTLVPKNRDAVVTDLDWARSILIEENRQVQEADWTLPAEAELVSQSREIHHYQSVLDHYEDVEVTKSRRVQRGYDTWTTQEDMGNGYFREVEHQSPHYETEYYTETESKPVYRNEPVYQTRYVYTIWRWFDARTVDTSGKDHAPVWGDTELGENEREKTRAEQYRIAVQIGDKVTVYALEQSVWETLNVGDGIRIRQGAGRAADLLDDSGNPIARLTKQ